MRPPYLTNTPLDEARAGYLAFLREAGLTAREERIPIEDALGRITAEAVYAALSAPHYVACAMDGIAVLAADTFGATETTPAFLSEAQFARVDTGDPLPPGYDAVVMIEDVVAYEGGIRLYGAATPWQHIRQIGEDIAAGDMLLPSYTKITPAAMGAMLAGGIAEVPVLARPVVGILPTGDELMPPSPNPPPGAVMEFNSTIFSGMFREWGAQPRVYPIVRDDPATLKTAIEAAIEECDALLIGAGTSAGRDDYTVSSLEALGAVYRHGIAIRPGKPAVLARIGEKPVLGVPGYPVSGILVLEQLFLPVLRALLHQPEAEGETLEARAARRIPSSLKYREFLRARIVPGPDGPVAVPLNRGAGVVSSFVKADAWIDIPQNAEGVEAGERLTLRLLRPKADLARTLSIVGSHDPLLDEAGDLLRRQLPGYGIASSHVGSMGGILAIRRGEAALAGVHLLDPTTGVYNRSYIERHFPGGGVALLRCVGRTQGILTAPGNPHGVKGIADLPGLRYVNRQGGSGTRVLLDHLLGEAGIDRASIPGYTREEYTHTAVAAQIAEGSADAGLGIYAAAQLYRLDFVPVYEEEYSLLLRRESLEEPLVQAFIAILKSKAFAARLRRLGGYTWENIGEEIPLS